MEKLNSNEIIKIGVVVRNIEDVARRYGELFNVPTPEVHYPDPNRVYPPEAYKRYYNQDYKIMLKYTHIDLSPIYIEILEPYDETPSPWLDHLKKFGPSVCFLSFYIKGFRQQIDLMEKQGYPLIFEEEKGHERYAYFDTLEKLGITLELKERDNL
ncbi:MAG: VOC family protein [Saccharofermentanales bacterium]|jgi:methylmalonyl-CoA/ethylmalonyl-CoA epimerase